MGYLRVFKSKFITRWVGFGLQLITRTRCGFGCGWKVLTRIAGFGAVYAAHPNDSAIRVIWATAVPYTITRPGCARRMRSWMNAITSGISTHWDWSSNGAGGGHGRHPICHIGAVRTASMPYHVPIGPSHPPAKLGLRTGGQCRGQTYHLRLCGS